MKKLLILIAYLTLLFSANASDKIFSISGLPENYSGKLVSNGNTDTVIIKYNKTGNTVISQTVGEFDVKDDIKNNRVNSMPYGEQSVIITEDFNFDGKQDIAIRDDNQGCYAEPAYQVYLNTGKTLEKNPEFTRLAQEYCGMFETNAQTQTLSTITKSSADWHQHTTFRVIKNKPVPIWILEEEFDGDLIQYTERKNLNGNWTETNHDVLATDAEVYGDDTTKEAFVFSFTVKNDKQMVLGHSGENTLFYAFRDKQNHVELFNDQEFTFDKEKNTLSFNNGNTKYTVSEKGILVSQPNREKAIPVYQTGKGKISDISSGNYENVIIK